MDTAIMTCQYYNTNESNKTHSNTQKIVASFYGDRTLEATAIATSKQSKPFDRGIAVLDKSKYQHSGDRTINLRFTPDFELFSYGKYRISIDGKYRLHCRTITSSSDRPLKVMEGDRNV
jgi:predicted component of viral defense system (DUF524 family)